MKVITLATVKTLLGITGTTQDATITAQIPIIDAKVKQICKNNFNLQLYGAFTSGSKMVEIYDTGYDCGDTIRSWPTPEVEDLLRDIPIGTLLEGDAIDDLTQIDEVYYNGNSQGGINVPTIQMSVAALATGTLYFYAGINAAYQNTIAHGILWLISQQVETIEDNAWISRKVGPLSLTRSTRDNELDGRSGMPAWFVKALPRYHR